MQVIPLDDIAYPSAFLVIKPLLGCCALEGGSRPRGFIAAEKHERVDFKEKI